MGKSTSDLGGSCPTCGAAVRVAGDPVEGTMHYEPERQLSHEDLSKLRLAKTEIQTVVAGDDDGFGVDLGGAAEHADALLAEVLEAVAHGQ